MIQHGDMVVYGIHGVCRIVNVENRVVDRKNIAYYVLEPCGQPDAKFYIPINNPVAVAKMRKLLSKEEVDALLDSDEVKLDAWIPDEAQRKERYRELISHSDCAELIQMVRAIYFHKQAQLAEGKKLHMCDENFMRDAERLVRSELSYVLDIPQEDVVQYIRDKLDDVC